MTISSDTTLSVSYHYGWIIYRIQWKCSKSQKKIKQRQVMKIVYSRFLLIFFNFYVANWCPNYYPWVVAKKEFNENVQNARENSGKDEIWKSFILDFFDFFLISIFQEFFEFFLFISFEIFFWKFWTFSHFFTLVRNMVNYNSGAEIWKLFILDFFWFF